MSSLYDAAEDAWNKHVESTKSQREWKIQIEQLNRIEVSKLKQDFIAECERLSLSPIQIWSVGRLAHQRNYTDVFPGVLQGHGWILSLSDSEDQQQRRFGHYLVFDRDSGKIHGYLKLVQWISWDNKSRKDRKLLQSIPAGSCFSDDFENLDFDHETLRTIFVTSIVNLRKQQNEGSVR